MSDLLNQASLVMVPSGYKEDTVYSVVPSDGSGDLSFTRASNGTRINSAGLVEDCPWNIVQQSETFTNAFWSVDNGTITANSTNAPNGTTTADTFTKTMGSAAYLYNGSFNLGIGQFTQSIYAKANASSSIRLEFVTAAFGRGAACIFDLSNGTAGSITIYGGVSGFTATIENVGNGWYRCSLGGTITIADTYYYEISITTGSIYIWGAQLNIGSTAKPYFPTTDRLNVPRLTYQNGGGGCPSLLLEKQSTNGLYPSEDFSTTWNLFNSATITTNQATSPDGTQNADKLTTANSANALYNVNDAGSSAGDYTASIFVKPINNNSLGLGMTNDTTGEAFVLINVATGVGTTTSQTGWSNATYTWQQHANGWYRITITATKGSSGAARFILKGNSSSDYYIWGAQIEASSYPTSYINTTSASATRVADACFKTGISSLIGQTAGVVFADFVYLGGVQAVAIELSNSASADDIINLYITSAAQTQCYMFDGGSQVGFISSSHTFVQGSRYKVAIGYASNDLVLYINGTQIGTATPSSIPTTSEIYISRDKAAAYLTETKYNEVVLFKTRLTNAELASLTTL
jgi:hypothetical protein